MIIRLAVKNIVSRRSSLIIILFITFAIMMFCVANAVFDSTENGVQKTYVSSFTGDILVRPQTETQLSLFGDETPVTGELTKINTLTPYEQIKEVLQDNQAVIGFTPQVTCVTSIEANGNRFPVYVFGVEAEEYVELMDSIEILDGNVFSRGEKGLMITEKTASRLGVSVGQEVQFVVADGPNFRIRAVRVSAVYKYEVYNEIFDIFVLLDGDTVRSLLDIDSGEFISDEYIGEDDKNLIEGFESSDDFDSLFIDANDSAAILDLTDNFESFEYETISDENNKDNDADDNVKIENSYTPSSTWNYLIVRLSSDANVKKEIRKLKRIVKKNGWPVDITDWRHAAGSVSLYLHWMRLIFNIGITIILIAGFIIVNNTLVVNVLDRTSEIGTLRAIGAKKRLISFECMTETFIMTLTGGFFGVLLAKAVCFFITNANIMFHNSFLIQLFGSNALQVYLNMGIIFKMFLIVIVLSLIGWVYPVINAIRISPVKAMQGGH